MVASNAATKRVAVKSNPVKGQTVKGQAARGAAGKSAVRLSIGQVIEQLKTDFADLSASKLRFLEDQGLVIPERTASGYRKYSQSHVERLRLVLTLQRDHYLPHKKIQEILTDFDEGRDPVIPGTAGSNFSAILTSRRVLTRDELIRATGVSYSLLAEAISAGLLPASDVFTPDATVQLTALQRLSEVGVTPRHLRGMRLAAEKDAELINQAVQLRAGTAGKDARHDQALQLAELLDTVRSGVVRQTLRRS